jgi:hypothetical protein
MFLLNINPCSFVRDTTSELESRDLADPIICQCRKHQQLVCQVVGHVACFCLNVSMVHSSTLDVITDGEHLTCGDFSPGETIFFGSLEFIIDYFGTLSLSLKGSDSGTVFVGTAHCGSPSLCTILKDSTNELYTAPSGEGSSGLPVPQRRSMGTSPAPIVTTPWLEDAPTPQTMTTVPPRTIALRPDTGLPPEQRHAFREGQRA